jgi:tRNA (cytidine/uridine-2'-O-)-methyltransferase
MIEQKNFNIVLFAPDIPGNTGSIGRTCVALGLRLILIKPYGFDLSEKAVRRAGLDYWKHVDIQEYESFDDFLAGEKPKREQLLMFENNVEQDFYDAPYQDNCYLIFGSETKGLPKNYYQEYKDRIFEMPMFSPHIRSLNLSNAATAVTYECLRCLNK